MLIVLLLLLCHAVDKVHCSMPHENSEDFHSLLEFHKGITNDPYGALSNWNTSTHFCHWHGVNCSSVRPYRVTGLNLTGQSLVGQISSSLGNLTFLNTLDLSNNSFSGSIPLLNKLQNLNKLSLWGNLLDGVIPDGLTNCSNLVSLDLSDNNLVGSIPSNIGFLTKLIEIYLYTNYLTGVIPPTLGKISTLEVVNLQDNQLNGSIPNEIWQMPNIVVLYLGQNNLSGGIPATLSLPSLTILSLYSNMLGSTLPSNIGDAFPKLQQLYLGNNTFEGLIPASLGNPSSLETIDLSINSFTGEIPSSFGNLSQLQILNLEENMLEARDGEGWQFFDSLENCHSLNTLSVSFNLLHGSIPSSISNLSNTLQYLLMSDNYLSGIVPPTIEKFSGLIKLSLGNNNLTGSIEEWVGKMTNLQYLRLQSNNFTGQIPPSIGDLTRLVEFSVAENNFSGYVPSNLGNLKSTLKLLDLSHNNFQGSIPVEFGNLELISLSLSSNKFSGQIPATLGRFEQIQTIELDQNVLIGYIPLTFSNLYSLSLLNLSHNNLSGPMPTFLSALNHSELDLSYNNFHGEIPRTGVFENSTAVSLVGNPGLCGGVMDLHMPPCHVASRRVGRASLLIKILIPIFGFMSLILLVYFLLLEKRTSRRAYRSEQSYGEHFEKVTYNDLAQATRDFSVSNLIGRGSYGSVYRGKLKESKMEVAVKVFDLEMRGAERSFLSECEALRSVQHRNLLPIITACSTVDNGGNVFKALIYEFMPNGSLDTWLHHKGDEEAAKRLGLTQRISIAVNIADALDYLHHDCGRPTVHCDLKPSNILLDDDMNALLGDFGIARFYHDSQSKWAGSFSSIGVKGTIGYIPPEYGGGGHVSTSGDVYSFGIVLLEILTSKRPTDPMFKDGLDIISFVENSFPDQVFQVIDAHLLEECRNSTQGRNLVQENEIYQCLVDLLQLALSCLHSLPSERSNMKQVASRMQAIRASYIGWKHK